MSEDPNSKNPEKIPQTDSEWQGILTPEEFYVLRLKGTEPAYTGEYWDHHEKGEYRCRACGELLFRSDHKYDSHCGWPSFYDAIDRAKIRETLDTSHGMQRIEVTCAKCGGHLGHVFPDGPKPTGIRYCINSLSIRFKPEGEGEK